MRYPPRSPQPKCRLLGRCMRPICFDPCAIYEPFNREAPRARLRAVIDRLSEPNLTYVASAVVYLIQGPAQSWHNRIVAGDATLRRAKSFEEGAVAYERFRPTFPDALFDDLVAMAGSRFDSGVLEVGAGTGRATLPLARRGAQLQVVEPSGDMLRVLRDRLHSEKLQDAVSVRQATFEDVVPDEGPYGVVIAAQSFHWADSRTRWTRLARLLGQNGIAFLFWNGWHLDPTQHDLDAVRKVYRRDGRGLVPDIDDHCAAANWAHDEIAAEPALTNAESTTYVWEWNYLLTTT